jgi:EAL domain-containing protein (putative c-di-GMP-specific phosphodiesterase class I)/ABC-type amino acid transport substrate-binding protein
MLFRLSGLWIVLLAALAFSPAAARTPVVVFGGDMNYPPFEWEEDGEAKGFLIDLEDAVARNGGARSLHKLAPWPDTVAALRSGAVDVVPMFRSAEREEDFWFSEPLIFVQHAIFTASDPGRVTDRAGLGAWRVAVEHSSFAHDQLTSEGTAGKLVLFGDTGEALEAVADGRADYAVLAEESAARLVTASGQAIRRVGPPFWPREYAFAVRKDRPSMVAWLDRSLGETISSGEFQRIQARWQQELDSEQAAVPNWLRSSWKVLLTLLLSIATGLLFLLWSARASLRRERSEQSRAERNFALPTRQDTRLLRDFAAFGKDEIYAVFQPQLDLRSGEIAGAEALVRWDHRTGGSMAPDQFIPQLERAGMVGEVTSRMIALAVAQSIRFREEGYPIRFSVNVSAKDFTDRDLADLVATHLARLGGCPKDLVLELTESGAVTDPKAVRAMITRLKSTGVRVAIDDYGTGFASLASFTELSFDELKIDRLFVEKMVSSTGHREAVTSAINMARRMKMEVVAEGAPDLATIQLLKRMRCDRVQSYAVSPPLSGDDLLSFVRDCALRTGAGHQVPTSVAAIRG